MGKLSRNKGKTGEREFAKTWELVTGLSARRTAQHMGKTGQAGDVESDDCPGLHFEVKRTERLNLKQALAQAIRDAEANPDDPVPVVAHRASREPWVISLRLEDLPRLCSTLQTALTKKRAAGLQGATRAEAFDEEDEA